jgi:multidrug resistance efflux pump
MAPDERRMTEGPLAFVDCDADNLRPGSLLGLRRRAPSFGGKGRRAVVESRDGQTQTIANVYPILTWVRLARRIPVCIHIDETPPSVVLAAGITAAVEIEHRARTE